MLREGTQLFNALLLLPVPKIKNQLRAHWLPNPTRSREVILITTDNRDILEVLRAELDSVERGGYGRSVRTPWIAKSVFQDSLTCLNYAYFDKVHPCSECHLIDFVPGDKRSEGVPCHSIPLNEAGETVEEFEAEANQQELERTLKSWLSARIREIETARSPKPADVS